MKLLLCSNFLYLSGNLSKFFDLTKEHNVLFVWYADESEIFVPDENGETQKCLKNLGFNIIYLNENYDFCDKIDMIYVKGGNTTKLLHFLKKFNQFDKIKNLVEQGVLYVGQSAGSVLAGSDTEWTLRSEPYEVDLKKEYGEGGLLGYGFVDKMVFVHASKLRFPFDPEIKNAGKFNFRVKNKLFYGEYLKDKKYYKNDEYMILGDNQAYYQNEEVKKIITFDWSKFPVNDEFRLF